MSRIAHVILGLTTVIAGVAATDVDGARPVRPQVSGDTLRFVTHEDYIPVGIPSRARPWTLTNPFEGDRAALATGARIFVAYNCIDCHGADGSGAMGPSFQDGRWRFGGSPGELFESIYQGRPEGMPAWGGRISEEQIWMLVAYVRSVSAGDLTTENFTGAAQERMGH
jgi:cytochrome c oxidase cbb3-type subunit 3